jgi:hypothetical protein
LNPNQIILYTSQIDILFAVAIYWLRIVFGIIYIKYRNDKGQPSVGILFLFLV